MEKNKIKATTAIKICGMTEPTNIVSVANLLPDYMGFIFYEKSSRNFKGIIPYLPSSVKKTGVFVASTIDEILEKVLFHDLQAVQLHGNESAYFCKDLKTQLSANIEIIKVFSVSEQFDFEILKNFENCCDFFLFDTKGKQVGGNGFTFNWHILENYPSRKPFFLSGGIGLEEIIKVKELLNIELPIYGIDFNSKLEIAAGIKNIKLCQEVLESFQNY